MSCRLAPVDTTIKVPRANSMMMAIERALLRRRLRRMSPPMVKSSSSAGSLCNQRSAIKINPGNNSPPDTKKMAGFCAPPPRNCVTSKSRAIAGSKIAPYIFMRITHFLSGDFSLRCSSDTFCRRYFLTGRYMDAIRMAQLTTAPKTRVTGRRCTNRTSVRIISHHRVFRNWKTRLVYPTANMIPGMIPARPIHEASAMIILKIWRFVKPNCIRVPVCELRFSRFSLNSKTLSRMAPSNRKKLNPRNSWLKLTPPLAASSPLSRAACTIIPISEGWTWSLNNCMNFSSESWYPGILIAV